MLKTLGAIASILTLALVAGFGLWQWSMRTEATIGRQRATLDAGLSVVAGGKLEEVYRKLPVGEPFQVKGFWFGDNGKPCGVAALEGGEYVRFVEVDEKPTYMIKGRPGWDYATWLAECNTPTFEYLKLS